MCVLFHWLGMSDLESRLAKLSPAQRALFEKRLSAERSKPIPGLQQEAIPSQAAEPIAIVGMACRLPGANTLDEYWQLIRGGRCAITETPADRWDVDALYDEQGGPGKVATRWGGFVEGIDQFDPRFFGVSPREANRMDPQQRLLLEVAWEALEHTGTPADTLAGSRTGVFVGIGGNDYSKVPLHSAPDYFGSIDGYMGTGNAMSIAANRLSYLFDLKGPSLAVDTACSSSSVAIYLAVEALRRGECDAAIAAGVNAILTPETTIAFSNAQMLSPRGRCRPFDAGADGYARGEGCGVVYLRRLSDAVRDGDQVLCVLRAAAINQDGRTSGISAPNGESQKACINAALRQASLSPEDLSYVEAHGTGTPLGDPIEMSALAGVFTRANENAPPLRVTSVKANIGHTETVSGIAGLIKVALMMRHGHIPAQLGLESLNPHIDLAGSRVEIPTEPVPWTDRQLAGISSFGFGGTNSHLIVQAPASLESTAKSPPQLGPRLLKLSTKSAEAVQAQAAQLVSWLAANPVVDLDDLCFTANTGRSDLPHRAVVVASNDQSLQSQLQALAKGQPTASTRRGQLSGVARRKTALLFSGQGSQLPGMGRDLYLSHAVFRKQIDRSALVFADLAEESLTDILFGERSESLIHQTIYTQPALFAVELALARLWQSWGVSADLVAGHSIGEYVAAVVAGVMDDEAGLRLVTERARLMQQAPLGGAMAAIFAAESRLAPIIEQSTSAVSIAAVNGPENTVISGERSAVEEVLGQLTRQGIEHRQLAVSHAFHSSMMEDVLDDFETFSASFRYRPPQLPMASNLTGALMTQAPTARYWRDHLRGTVRFADNLRCLAKRGASAWIEAGPGAALLGMVKRTLPDDSGPLLASLRKGVPDAQVLASSVAEHYAQGGQVDWRAWDPEPRQRLLLPTYPFQRTRCWIEDASQPSAGITRQRSTTGTTLLGDRAPTAWSSTVFESLVSSSQPAFLVDHQVQGSVVLPAAYYMEQTLQAAATTFGEGRHAVESLRVSNAMLFADDAARRLQVVVGPESGGRSEVTISSQPFDGNPTDWTEHANATLVHRQHDESASLPPPLDWTEQAEELSGTDFYQRMKKGGFAYGVSFQAIEVLRIQPRRALAYLKSNPAIQASRPATRLHPVLGDACLQTFAAALAAAQSGSGPSYLPVSFGQVELLSEVPADAAQLCCVAHVLTENVAEAPDQVTGEAWLLDHQGQAIACLRGICVQKVGGPVGMESSPRDWLYQVQWQQSPLESPSNAGPAEGAWLILADKDGLAQQLGHRLTDGRATVILARSSDSFTMEVDQATGITQVCCDLADEEHIGKLLQMVTASPSRLLSGVIYAAESSIGALLLTQQLIKRAATPVSGCWFVTTGAQSVASVDTPLRPQQAPLVGFGRVVQTEHPELKPILLDLDPGAALSVTADCVFAEITANDQENEISYRGSDRWVARLQRVVQSTSSAEIEIPRTGRHQLRIGKPGTLEALHYEPIDGQSLAPDEVEFQVHSTGLNFSDVLKALGLYPGVQDTVVPLGIEASGIVTAVGEQVDRFAVGDEVFGVAPYALGSHAVTGEYTLAPKPSNITHDQAATLPITFLTAHHALVRLADLQSGERVLIHAGAGGVGLAAIQIAQSIGAEVFATAGSEEKRDYLRSLGVEHVYNSRTLDFADEILDATAREGIDVVLNSLPGEAITRSLQLLRAYGRFCEIGKIDIYQDRRLGLLPFRDNLSYFAIDLDRVLRQRPGYVRRLMADVVERVVAGDYQPLALTHFGREQTINAFRYMSQRKNIGKVVIGNHGAKSQQSNAESLAGLHGGGCYLITGGLGALGLQVAERFAREGAGAVALLSRRPPSKAIRQRLATIEAQGAQVICIQADVADLDSLKAAIQELAAGDSPPLRGVVHAAGVLEDGLLSSMTPEQFMRVLQPKFEGAWNLHHATSQSSLDFFVLFSSVAAVFGSPGQANYAAANAGLDALAAARRQAGLPALSINWGPWAETGMAADVVGLEDRGMRSLPASDALDLLMQGLREKDPQVVIADVDWPAMRRMLAGRSAPMLEELMPPDGEISGKAAFDSALRQQLLMAQPDERNQALVALVRSDLARVMSIEESSLEVSQPLAEFGIDSLMSLELKNSVERKLGVTLPMAKLLEGPSIASLADELTALLGADRSESGCSSQAWSPLTTLREGQGSPLFLMPALGGDVTCYRSLAAAMPEGSPVVALRPRGLDDDAPPHDAMPRLAEDYAAALRSYQPEGSYRLAGWSTGGVPALAVAEELEREGLAVEFVALLDTPLPSVYRNVQLDDHAGFLHETLEFAGRFEGREISLDRSDLQELPQDQQFNKAVTAARQSGLAVGMADSQFLRRVVAVGAGLVRASRQYQPPTLTAPVLLFRPTTDGALPQVEVDGLEDHGWRAAGVSVSLHEVAGDHFTMMTGEGARQIGKHLATISADELTS